MREGAPTFCKWLIAIVLNSTLYLNPTQSKHRSWRNTPASCSKSLRKLRPRACSSFLCLTPANLSNLLFHLIRYPSKEMAIWWTSRCESGYPSTKMAIWWTSGGESVYPSTKMAIRWHNLVGNSVGIENTVEVIDFVLEDDSGEATDGVADCHQMRCCN